MEPVLPTRRRPWGSLLGDIPWTGAMATEAPLRVPNTIAESLSLPAGPGKQSIRRESFARLLSTFPWNGLPVIHEKPPTLTDIDMSLVETVMTERPERTQEAQA